MQTEYEFLSKNVKMFWGTSSTLASLLNKGWYIVNGQTATNTLFGTVTLPNLTSDGCFPVGGSYSGNVLAPNVGTSKWTFSVGENNVHKHDYQVSANNAGLTGSGHTHAYGFTNSSVNANRSNVNSVNWGSVGVSGYNAGNRSNNAHTFYNAAGNSTTNNSVSTNNHNHSHSKNINYSSIPDSSNAGAHTHNISFTNNSNSNVTPSALIFVPVVYLGEV